MKQRVCAACGANDGNLERRVVQFGGSRHAVWMCVDVDTCKSNTKER